MAIQTETLTCIYTFLGDFLEFLKTCRILDTYTLVHSNVSDSVSAQRDEEFVEGLLSYLERLQGLLATCSKEKHYTQLVNAESYSCFVEKSLVGKNSDVANIAEDNNPSAAWQESCTAFEVTPRTESFDELFDIAPKAQSLQAQEDCLNAENSSTEEESDEETPQEHADVDQEETANYNGEEAKEGDTENKKVEEQLPLGLSFPKSGPYMCAACDKEFRDKATLLRHYRKHTGEKPFMCEHCKKCFSFKANLDAHLLRIHDVGLEKALCCSVCGKLFSRKNSLEVHMTIHQDSKPFECSLCGHTFSQKVSLKIHIASQHTGELNYSCEVCKKTFASSTVLKTHRLTHGPPQSECDLCGQRFHRPDVLKLHREVRHAPPDAPVHQCSSCGKTFPTASRLAAHVQTHNTSSRPKRPYRKVQRTQASTPYLCSTCGKKCCRLRDHEKRCHADIPAPTAAFACTYCPKTFAQKAKLQMHIVSHLEEPQYACELCGRRFRRKDSLDRHLALHADPQPYACEHCERRYSSRFSLQSHVESHHTERSEAPRFSCAICGKVYLQKSSFTEHMKKHAGEFRYQCEHVNCGKQFVRHSHYKSHLRAHGNERPYQCETCKRSYKEQKHLREHVRRMHPQVLSLEALVASLGDEDVAAVDGGAESLASGVGTVVQEVTLLGDQGEVATVLAPFIVTGLPM